MKLDDFLKYKKVRYINLDVNGLTKNKEYELLGVTDRSCIIINDDGFEIWASMDNFEPVLDSAENPLQNMKLKPEFETEASEPKFEVGNKVYVGLTGKIETVEYFDIRENEMITQADEVFNAKKCCHATPENYERLQATFPNIKFERPPLTGNELCRKLLDKGEKYIMAKDDTDTWRIICDYCDDWFTDVVTGKCLKNVTPVNSKGKPLTESILND